MHVPIAAASVGTATPPPAAASAASDILVELTAGLAAGDDLRQLLQRFLEPIVQIAGAQAGAVRILDSHEHRMHLVGELGLPSAVLEAERSVEHDCGVCGAALVSDKPVWADDLTPCLRRNDDRYFDQASRRVLAVPLHHRGRVLGLFNLFFEGGREPPAGVPGLLKPIGELLGLALDNARLEREHLRTTVLAERQAMAADMHDSIGQSLAFVKMRLPLLHDAIQGCDRPSAERYFDDVRSAVAQAHASLRGILTHARTPIDPLGLTHALQTSAQAFRRSAGVSLEFVDEVGPLRLGAERETQVFHVVQEALTNIARHARARQAWLHITTRAGGFVQITVEDDGAGVPPAAGDADAHGSTHYGLAIMRERAQRLDGTLSVEARAGGGTRVRLEFPLRGTTPEAH